MPESPDQIEKLCYCWSQLSQYYIQVQPDIMQAQQYAEKAARTGLLQGLIQQDGVYLVTEQAQECEELASQIFSMFLEKNLIIKKEDGVYEPNPCKGIPDTQTLINYSRVLVDLQQLDEAQVIIELAIRMTDEDPVLIHELAWIYNLKGEYYDTV